VKRTTIRTLGTALAAAFLLCGARLLAQDAEAAPTPAELAAMIEETKIFANNAWMLVSCALVLMMTAPGLVLFYGGLVRTKNVLSVMMQGFFCMAVVSILWFAYGYTIAFGADGNKFIGGLGNLFLNGVGQEATIYKIPDLTFMLFQLMFAIITPALITGAFAERFRFKALVVFVALWVTVVYFPLAHMVWGGGLLATSIPALDFAGGTVVHISSGVSALVCAMYLGKRRNWPGPDFAPHNLVISAIGAGLLWVGWFGFNAGSACAADGIASSAFASTHMSAAGAAFSWMVAEWITRKKPSALGVIAGVVAGLVGITPGAGFVTPGAGLIIGLVTGVVCFAAVTYLKPMLKVDDSLDVFGVHGVGGILGAVLTGVFATKVVNPIRGAAEDGTINGVGLVDGVGKQVVDQILAVGVTVVLAVVATLVILFIVDKLIGIRPTAEEEMQGLDFVDHGEAGYHHGGGMGSSH